MKFLCVPCDSPMTLHTVAPPDRGSLSVVYACPECGYEIAMLTNAFETQLVQSLGVRIGSGSGAETSSTRGVDAATSPDAASRASAAGGRCPFSAMIPAGRDAADRVPADVDRQSAQPAPAAVRWTTAAEARLARVPEFVRPMARLGIERFARERGAVEVDETMLEAAREFFGM